MEKRKNHLAAVLAAAFLGLPSQVFAIDLLEAYRKAVGFDATFRAEQAALEAARENVPQARAQFLPSISVSGNVERNKTELEYLDSAGKDATRDLEFYSPSYRVSLTQPVFRFRSIAQYRQAQAQERHGEARFLAAQNDLFLRVSQGYFDFLLAEDNLGLIRAQKTAYQEQLEQARKMYGGGVGTITDVHEAKARLDIVVSQEVQASNELEIRRRQLAAIIGERVGMLARLTRIGELANPEPDSDEHWTGLALEQNSAILVKRANLDYARHEASKSRGDHLPTVDAFARWSYEKNPGYTNINQKNTNSVVGVQFAFPVFQGGAVVSRSRQTEAQYRQAQEELDAEIRKVTTQTSEYFLAMRKGVIEVNALQQAVFSSESALHSTRMGFKAGTRTTLDILNAQQQVFQSRRDLSRAKYEYLMSKLQLRASAGVLAEEDIVMVNSWLK